MIIGKNAEREFVLSGLRIKLLGQTENCIAKKGGMVHNQENPIFSRDKARHNFFLLFRLTSADCRNVNVHYFAPYTVALLFLPLELSFN